MTPPTPATDEIFQLAESPVWDADRNRLLWVDILGRTLLEGALDRDMVTVTFRHRFREMVGAVTFSDDGTLLVAAQERLVILRPDGTRKEGPQIIPTGQSQRLNDGGTDPAGRFLIGTLSLRGPSEREMLIRLDSDGGLTELDGDLTLSNGLAWSVDGTLMYSVDTLSGNVFVRDYDAATGAVGTRHVHLHVVDGVPDGIAVDEADHLWVAIWGSGEVHRYDADGNFVDRISVPAPHTSSVAFAGNDLRTLVITTATAELSHEQQRAYPDSGRLFTVGVDVPGLAVHTWSGILQMSATTD